MLSFLQNMDSINNNKLVLQKAAAARAATNRAPPVDSRARRRVLMYNSSKLHNNNSNNHSNLVHNLEVGTATSFTALVDGREPEALRSERAAPPARSPTLARAVAVARPRRSRALPDRVAERLNVSTATARVGADRIFAPAPIARLSTTGAPRAWRAVKRRGPKATARPRRGRSLCEPYAPYP